MTMKSTDEITAAVIESRYSAVDRPTNEYDEAGLTRALAEGDVDNNDIEEMIASGIDMDRAQFADGADRIADEHYAGYGPSFPPEGLAWSHLQQSLRDVARAAFRAGIVHEQARRVEHAPQHAESVVLLNYGPDADEEVYVEAQGLSAVAGLEPEAKTILDAAIQLNHLDGDGIFAMLKTASR